MLDVRSDCQRGLVKEALSTAARLNLIYISDLKKKGGFVRLWHKSYYIIATTSLDQIYLRSFGGKNDFSFI